MDPKKNNLFRNQLALTSLLFFWPLTQWMIKGSHFDLDIEEKRFIGWYIKVGLFSSILLLIYIMVIISKYYFRGSILEPISRILIIIILWIIIIWIIWIFSNINVQERLYIDNFNINKKNVILKYIPIVNIYLRYNNHNFEKPDEIVKEAILLWTIFTISLVISTSFTITTVIIIILKFVANLMWVDIFNKNTKIALNKLFNTNPEEIRWYISGFTKYILQNRQKKNSKESFIFLEKEEYKKLYNTKDIFHIKLQYGLLIIILWILGYFSGWNTSILIFIWLIIWRYAVMQFKWAHLPSIPIIKETIFFVIKTLNNV